MDLHGFRKALKPFPSGVTTVTTFDTYHLARGQTANFPSSSCTVNSGRIFQYSYACAPQLTCCRGRFLSIPQSEALQ